MQNNIGLDVQDHAEKVQYLCQVTIIEARSLKPIAGDKTRLCSPFVKIRVADQPAQVTRAVESTNSATWGQSFTIPELLLSETELQKFEILLEVLDQSDFFENQLIGSFSIGLATLYNSLNHEYYREWISLCRPSNQGGYEESGMLLISCYLISKSDRPPVRQIGESNPFAGVVEEIEDLGGIKLISNPQLNVLKYQLNINIVRLEDLPKMGMLGTSSFVAVKVGQHLLKTQVLQNNQKPEFSCKLNFPVTIPSMNDKIVMKVWDQGVIGMSEEFISNIPENPFIDSRFTINYLQSTGGNLPFTWVNLYGIPPDERQSLFSKLVEKKRHYVEGTDYMGRCLLSINLISHENPYLGYEHLSGCIEPESLKYVLRVDILELQMNIEKDECKIQAKFGGKKAEETKIGKAKNSQAETKGAFRLFSFKGTKGAIPDIKANFPKDLNQVPDIFLNVLQNGLRGWSRIGYVRIPVTLKNIESNRPTWYDVQNPHNHESRDPIGILLADVRLLKGPETEAPRATAKHQNDVAIKFFAFVFGCFELDPEVLSDNIHARVEVFFNNLGPKFSESGEDSSGFSATSSALTRNPVFCKGQGLVCYGETKVIGSVEYAPNIRIVVRNMKKGGIFSSEYIIGSTSIHPTEKNYVHSLKNDSDLDPDNIASPKFITIRKDGKITGKLLAYLAYSEGVTDKVTIDRFRRAMFVNYTNYNLNFACIGLRNLDQENPQPEIELRIPSYGVSLKYIPSTSTEHEKPPAPIFDSKVDTETTPDQITGWKGVLKYDIGHMEGVISNLKSFNPNICLASKIEEIRLPSNPIFLPRAELVIKSTSSSFFWEVLYTSINLVECLDSISSTFIKSYLRDLGIEKFGQDTQAKEKAAKEEGRDVTKITEERTRMFSNSVKGKLLYSNPGDKTKKSTIQVKELPKIIPIIEDESREQIGNSQYEEDGFDNPFGPPLREKSPRKVEKDSRFMNNLGILNSDADRNVDANNIMNVYFEDLEPLNLINKSSSQLTANGYYNGFKIMCESSDKHFEKQQRRMRINEIKGFIKRLKSDPNYSEEKLREYILEIKQIKDEFITEKKFNANRKASKENQFNYGREVIKKPFEEITKLPYSKIPLYSCGKNLTTKFNKFVHAGRFKGGILKGGIRLSKSQRFDEYERGNQLNHRGERDKEEEIFNIYEPYLIKLFSQIRQVKVRLFLLRATNLAAQASETGLKERAAGYTAKSSANPYPYILVGDGKNDVSNGLTKMIDDSLNFKEKELNPSFFTKYQLDAFLPGDWNFQLCIRHKGSMFSNPEIGIRSFDLEDRFFSDEYRINSYAYSMRIEYLRKRQKELRDNRGNADLRAEKKRDIERINTELKKYEEIFKSHISQKKETPIEYSALSLPGKFTMQGSVEILLQVLEPDEAREVEMPTLEPPKPQKFEIRLIIWDVNEVPIEGKKALKLFMKATMNSEGWSTEGIEKLTDTHLGVEDGKGQFNYRMLFPLTLPCAFPRIKIESFDMSTVGSDEAIGSVTFELGTITKKLETEGRFDSKTVNLKMKEATNGLYAGTVRISIKIIPIEEAISNPVGEAQDAPNHDPFLEKPGGRGAGDYLKSIDFSFLGLAYLLGTVKYVGMGIGLVLIFWILFISPGIITKGK